MKPITLSDLLHLMQKSRGLDLRSFGRWKERGQRERRTGAYAHVIMKAHAIQPGKRERKKSKADIEKTLVAAIDYRSLLQCRIAGDGCGGQILEVAFQQQYTYMCKS